MTINGWVQIAIGRQPGEVLEAGCDRLLEYLRRLLNIVIQLGPLVGGRKMDCVPEQPGICS